MSISLPTPPAINSAQYDQLANFLISGYWDGVPRSFDTSADNIISVSLGGLTAESRNLARAALETWEMVADIRFQEVSSNADITIDDAQSGAFASSLILEGDVQSVEVNIGQDRIDRYGSTIDGYAFQTMVHEIGHALGLGHQGEYDGGAEYETDATFALDSWQVSVMSYFNQIENTETDASYARLGTAMIADIIAIQEIYGAAGAGSVTAGNTIYGANSNLDNYLGELFNLIADGRTNEIYGGDAMAFTIADVGGIDTINLSYTTAGNTIRLAAESISDVDGGTGNMIIARGTVIENVTTGSGRDTIYGTDIANVIRAGDGADFVNAQGGSDLVYGDGGNDTVYSGLGGDTLYGGDGADELWAGGGADVILGGNGLDLMGGGAGNDALYGGGSSDTIYAGAGNDILGGSVGNDQLWGGAGVDTVYAGDGDDQAGGGAGVDLVFTGNGSDTIFGGLGDDTVGGGNDNDAIYAGDGDDYIYGGNGNDSIFGGDGNDTLNGGGGDDTFNGGSGSDTFIFNGGADIIIDFDAADDNERVSLVPMNAITDFTDLMDNHATQSGADVIIDAGGGDVLTLRDVSLGALDTADFIF